MHKYLICADDQARKEISDGAPIDAYYGYDCVEKTADGAVFECENIKVARQRAKALEAVWAEQGAVVKYNVIGRV